jgi:EAL and modified HD-GYP domain-containing signal transduction protein
MWKWLLRLLGLNTSAPASTTPPRARAGAENRGIAHAAAGGVSGIAATAPQQATATLANPSAALALQVLRRPLLQQDGSLAGFEHSVAAANLASAEAEGTADRTAEARALLTAMGYTVTSGRRALAVLESAWLADPQVQALIQPGMMFGLADNPFQQARHEPLLSALKRQGAVLGSTGLPRASAAFVVFDAAGLDRQGLLDRARACAAAAPSAQVVATGIRTLDDLEASLHGGYAMAAGLFDRVGTRRESGSLAPNVQRLCRLINRVMTDADTGPIADEIRGDVGLTYRMLRHANSPLLGLTRTVESVDQALQLMGRQALYRWLTTLLVASATSRHTSVALQEITLARARMMEQLAPSVGGPPAALFTTGLLSLLDVMLEVPMAEALAPLSLPPEAHAALVEQTGPWRPLIEVARCLESGQNAQAEQHAQALGGLDTVVPAMTEAWQWAAQVTASLKQP